MKQEPNKRDVSLLAFRATLLTLVFLLGSWLALQGVHPFEFLEDGYEATKTLAIEQTQTRPKLMGELVYQSAGVTNHAPEQAYEGLTALQGWFAPGPEVRLIDMHGNIVHKWNVDFFKIWPDPVHIYPEENVPKTRFHFHTQGLAVLPDGSIVVNVNNHGTAKLDKCGNVVWTVNRKTHHSISRTADGGCWIPSSRDVRKVQEDLFLPKVTKEFLKKTLGRYENMLLLVDANGEIQKEFSVLEALLNEEFEHHLYDMSKIKKSAPTQVNDIDIVTAPLAQKIDDVHEGDLLVSI